jgi:hypothetical protein
MQRRPGAPPSHGHQKKPTPPLVPKLGQPEELKKQQESEHFTRSLWGSFMWAGVLGVLFTGALRLFGGLNCCVKKKRQIICEEMKKCTNAYKHPRSQKNSSRFTCRLVAVRTGHRTESACSVRRGDYPSKKKTLGQILGVLQIRFTFQFSRRAW